MEVTWSIISMRGRGENGGKGTGNKKHGRYTKDGEVNYSIKSGEPKEHMYDPWT